MYKWKIDVILTSGAELTVYYFGDEPGSLDVGKRLFEGAREDILGLFSNENKSSQIFIRREAISVMKISVG